MRGYVQSIGFRKCSIEYEAKDRQAGESKYNIRKLMKLFVNALLNFSNKPLKFAGVCSGFTALLGIVIMIYTIYTKFAYGTPNGYATIIVVLCFMFMMLFALIGVIGEYIGILFLEMKDRPIYIVRETKNMEEKN